jgi:hypothetical protein
MPVNLHDIPVPPWTDPEYQLHPSQLRFGGPRLVASASVPRALLEDWFPGRAAWFQCGNNLVVPMACTAITESAVMLEALPVHGTEDEP